MSGHRRVIWVAALGAALAFVPSGAAQARTVKVAEVLTCGSLERGKCPPLDAARADTKTTIAASSLTWLQAHPNAEEADVSKLAQVIGELGASAQCADLVKRAGATATVGHVDLLMAAARLRCNAAVVPLKALLSADGKQRELVLAAGALGVLGVSGSGAVLLPHLQSKWPRMQAAAAQALGVVGDSSAVAPLMRLAGSPTVYTPARLHALDSLARLKAVDALGLAVTMVQTTPRKVGSAALDVIAASPVSWTRPVIALGLKTEGLRVAACRAAIASPHAELADIAKDQALLDTMPAPERIAILRAVGELRPIGAAPSLLIRLEKGDQNELIALMKALPKLGDRTVVPKLVRYLPHAEPEVAKFVVYALENVTGEKLGLDVQAWQRFAGIDPDGTPAAAGGAGPKR